MIYLSDFKRNVFFLFACVLSLAAFSQSYLPMDSVSKEIKTRESEIFLNITKSYQKQISSELKGAERKFVSNAVQDIGKDFNSNILKGNYVFNTEFNDFIDTIVNEIVKNNPRLPSDLKFYVAKDVPLNASFLGGKIFVVNMGSFYFLDNEDQLAAVISHELAHYLQKHFISELQYKYSMQNNNDLKEDVQEINRSKIGKDEKALEKLKGILYDLGNFRRESEYEADSVGYMLFKNTKYHKQDYLNAFRLLENFDTISPRELKLETYKQLYSLPEQPFQDKWMKTEDFTAYDYSKYKEKFNEDSIRTHPEIEKRIAKLKTDFPELQHEESPVKPTPYFSELSRTSALEQPSCLMHEELYGIGIYYCMYRLQDDDYSEYHKEWLGKFFGKIYDARKTYTLNRYLDRIEPKNQPQSYIQFLSFMWNLNLSELKTIADYYSKKNIVEK